MPILMDKILTEYAHHVFEAARLRRNGVQKARDRVFAEMLIELEEAGDAMRFLDGDRIAWKATPKLRQYLKDLELVAQDDLEDVQPCSTVNEPPSLFQRKR